MFFPNPISQFIPNINEVCLVHLFILVSFTIYEICDYSKVYDEYIKRNTLDDVDNKETSNLQEKDY